MTHAFRENCLEILTNEEHDTAIFDVTSNMSTLHSRFWFKQSDYSVKICWKQVLNERHLAAIFDVIKN